MSIGRKILDKVSMPISYASSYVRSLKYGDELFRDPKTFCMFIGYPRSGHSIVGALIDAHPDAVVSHELDVLKFIRAGFSKRQIFTMILRTSEGYARRGRVARDYTYRVPNQWHGRFRNLRVIGDKKGPGSMNKLRDDLKLTDRLQKTTGTDIR